MLIPKIQKKRKFIFSQNDVQNADSNLYSSKERKSQKKQNISLRTNAFIVDKFNCRFFSFLIFIYEIDKEWKNKNENNYEATHNVLSKNIQQNKNNDSTSTIIY